MNILVPLDQSDRDRLILSRCTDLARNFGAGLTLLHIVPRAKAVFPGPARDGEAYLNTLAAGLRSQGLLVDVAVRRGDAAEEIISVAGEVRGRRGWDKFVLGSVTQTIIERCPQPVLIINEETIQSSLNESVRLQSYYLAGVVWRKTSKGDYTPEQAMAELERLAVAGLDRAVLEGTYEALAKEGASSDWLDLNFQVETLQRYLPGELPVVSEGDPRDRQGAA
jgi:nucleotide-binding universal stress UspA family protein